MPNRECFVSQAVIDALHFKNGIIHTRNIGISSLIADNYFKNSQTPLRDHLGTLSYETLSNNNGAIPCSDHWYEISLNQLKNNMIDFYTKNKNEDIDIKSNLPENIKIKSIEAIENVINKVINR